MVSKLMLAAQEFALKADGDPRCRESLNDATWTVRFNDGQQRVIPGDLLPAESAAGLIGRTGRIESIDVDLPAGWLLS